MVDFESLRVQPRNGGLLSHEPAAALPHGKRMEERHKEGITDELVRCGIDAKDQRAISRTVTHRRIDR